MSASRALREARERRKRALHAAENAYDGAGLDEALTHLAECDRALEAAKRAVAEARQRGAL